MKKSNSENNRTYHPVGILRLQSIVNQFKTRLNRVFKPNLDKTKPSLAFQILGREEAVDFPDPPFLKRWIDTYTNGIIELVDKNRNH